jgi:competence ComEA-like helix-hairpin-helix protein
MSKLNINDATREELVEKAGLRPELADAILAFRGKHGKITDVEALDELHGVGPVTLEQLRTSLSFSDKREKAGTANGSDKTQERKKDIKETAVKTAQVANSNGGDKAQEREKDTRETAVKVAPEVSSNGSDKAQEREKDTRETAVKTAEVVTSAARGSVKVARDTTEAGTQAISAMARGSLQRVEKASGALGELQHETARQSAELGQLFVELLNEQTRHNLQVAAMFGRVVSWDEVIQVQGEFVRASFERMNQLNARYLEIFQGMMRAATSTAQDQARKAA